MSATHDSTLPPRESDLHEIRVHGHLDERWADWLEGLAFTHGSDGTTTLTGPLADQAALHGVLNRIETWLYRSCLFDAWSPTEKESPDEAIVRDQSGSAAVLTLWTSDAHRGL
jgi:hypothetical protein